MLKQITAPLVLTAALFTVNAAANEDVSVGKTKYHIGVGVLGDIEGSTGDSLHSNGGLVLEAGYRFAPRWSVNGYYTYANRVGFDGSEASTDIHRLIADVNFDFTPDSVYSVYLLGCIGYEMMPDAPVDRDGPLIGFGGGLRYYFSESFGINLTAISKYDLDHTDHGMLLNAALTYRF